MKLGFRDLKWVIYEYIVIERSWNRSLDFFGFWFFILLRYVVLEKNKVLYFLILF